MVKNRLNMVDVEKEILLDPRLAAHLLMLAEKAARFAQQTAPVGDPIQDKHSGEYRDSIKAELHKGSGTHLLSARVVAEDFKAVWVEKGSIHNKAYHTLENSLHHIAGI